MPHSECITRMLSPSPFIAALTVLVGTPVVESFIHNFSHLLHKVHLGRFIRPAGDFMRTDVVDVPDCSARTSRSAAQISDDDAETVMEKLGLWIASAEDDQSERRGRCCGLSDAAYGMLEEKEAYVEELEEAFQVFDEDGDGLISAEELQKVMGKLGLPEGKRLEDCRKMIEVYDENGDERISPREFKNLLECAR